MSCCKDLHCPAETMQKTASLLGLSRSLTKERRQMANSKTPPKGFKCFRPNPESTHFKWIGNSVPYVSISQSSICLFTHLRAYQAYPFQTAVPAMEVSYRRSAISSQFLIGPVAVFSLSNPA